MFPAVLVVGLVLWLLDVDGLRSTPLWGIPLVAAGTTLVLGPLYWMRIFVRPDARQGRWWLTLGLALAWVVVGSVLLLGAVALVAG